MHTVDLFTSTDFCFVIVIFGKIDTSVNLAVSTKRKSTLHLTLLQLFNLLGMIVSVQLFRLYIEANSKTSKNSSYDLIVLNSSGMKELGELYE